MHVRQDQRAPWGRPHARCPREQMGRKPGLPPEVLVAGAVGGDLLPPSPTFFL